MTSTQNRVRCALTASIALIGVVSGLALTPAPASAEIGPELVRFGEHGSGAGQLDLTLAGGSGGIATDPDTGHVFVTERGNNRISEFTAWGEFVKAWGWGVRDGAAELQTCSEETGCQQGLEGTGAGQMSVPAGIAVDPSGNVFVFESINSVALGENQRIQKFSPGGEFLLMAGGEVNKTTGADVCTKADLEGGDTCGAGIPGTGPGEFSREEGGFSLRDVLDIGPDGLLYVADQKRIQSFDLNGGFQAELPFATIHASNPLFPEAPTLPVGSLAIDPLSGDFLLAFVSNTVGLEGDSTAWRVSQSGTVLNPAPLLSTFESAPERLYADAVATDPAGNAYVALEPSNAKQVGAPRLPEKEKEPSVRQFNSAGSQVDECCLSPSSSLGDPTLSALATNTVTAAGGVDLYVVHFVRQEGKTTDTFIEAVGPPPDKWPPPSVPPDISAQFASSVGGESAILKAEIDPNFWADTSYQLEYGTADCTGGGCQAVLDEPRQLGAGIVKKDVTTDGIALAGLEPGTTYHYRFVAESGGGDPTYGPDRTFTTYTLAQQTSSACPNQALRSGPSAALTDCRAYEMASPVDKQGADLSTFIQITGYLARLDQGAASGEKVTYSASTAFGDAPGGPYSSQYLSTRGAGGWTTTAISPAQDSGSVFGASGLDSPFRAFSEDLSSGWFVHGSDPPLAAGALEGFGNLYRRDNLAGAHEALSTVEPPLVKPENFIPTLLGFSADGARSFFRARGQLTPDASANAAIEQVYEAHAGQLRLVSAKPNGAAATVDSTVGAPKTGLGSSGREVNVDTAVSADGRLVYWTEEGGGAKLYLRVEAAETVAVSGASAATFWRASTDGGRMLYAEAGALKRFEESTRESSTLVPGGLLGVLGASDDLSRIYFASTSVLAEGASAGEPNLYLHTDGGALRFIATLASEEIPGGNVENRVPAVALSPLHHFARVTPDGQVAIFMSREPLTGAENLDRDTGVAVGEVFRYDAQADGLACLSCLPTGARPQAAELKILTTEDSGYFYAAKIPGSEFQFHAPRALSGDGGRAYFDSVNRLTLTDTNGRSDVYQWEAEGKGECVDPDAPGYDPASGGCVTLISDGRGSTAAEFIDASTDGSDVFFFTGTSLLPQDSGQIDVYDARIDGGFPQPPAPAAQCEGEACQSPVSPPAEPSYASQGYQGPGNPKAAKQKKAKQKSKKASKKKAKSKKAAKKAKRQKARAKGGRR
jgi:hypothetical protein